MKLIKRGGKIFAVILAIFMSVSVVMLSACAKKENFYKIPQADLPTGEEFALKKYDYENISDVQTTVRADVRNVLERGIARPRPEILSDNFSLVYDTTTKELTADYENLAINSETVKTATITFDKYPAPNLGVLKSADSPVAGNGLAVNGFDAFSNGTMNGQPVSSASDGSNYSLFYKYMLISQGQHLAAEAAYRSANGTLTQEWLKKHPAADAQYGAVLGTDNAVKKEITLDPIYRSYHATGLYLPAGEAVTVKVEGLKQGERLKVVLGVQDSLGWAGGATDSVFNSLTGGLNKVSTTSSAHSYFTKADVLTTFNQLNGNVTLQGQWGRQHARLPWLHAEFTFTENKEYTIGTPFGGAIEISMENCYSRAKTTFTGAVETPHYVLGQTTPEYFDEYLRDAPGVIAVLDTENGQLIGPTGEMGTKNFMRQVKTDEIDKLALLWHSFLSVNESFTGGTYNRFNKIMFDWHVPAGAAVALGNYSFAQPTGWFSGAMNYRGLLSYGTWGTLHEIGHNHASSYGTVWGFGCNQEGEVRNNALILLSYISLCDVGTTIRNGGGAEHGAYANPYSTLTETIAKKGTYADTNNCGYFEILGMYANIMHSFGAEKFYELLYTYKDAPSFSLNETATLSKRADFAYRCTLVYQMNFVKYFNDFYSAGLKKDMFTEEQWTEMSALPNYEPVSCFYAGGIDGVKTSGDYIVTFGDDITFDLLGNTISTLDTADEKGFEIVRVNQPEHGKIKKSENGKWIYSFNKKYTGIFDTFSFVVKLSDGVMHTLSVTLRITYNGGRVSVYKDVQGNNFDEILQEIEGRTPDEIIGTSTGAINNYNTVTGQKEVRISEFYWKAPVTGTVSVSGQWDDWAKIYFGESFKDVKEISSSTRYTKGYSDYNINVEVEEGKYYAVKLLNVNTGGGGSASVAFKYEGRNAYAQANQSDVFHPTFPLGADAPTYIYEPQFLISKKDSIKLGTTGTDKSEWKVVSAPENIVGGRKYKEIQYDTDPDSETYGEVKLEVEKDRWDLLIDGLDNTNMHTTYGGGVPKITPDDPQEFIIDTSTIQSFNYFSVVTRNNVNSYITDFELQIAEKLDENLNGVWTTVATGDRSNYSGTKITLKFNKEIVGRYWRLVVKGTTGGNFSVLAELDAGIQSTTQQVISPTSNKLFATKGWKNSAEIAGVPNGYLISEKKNQKLVIKFQGESIAVYGATGENFGSGKVYIDGKKAGSFNLNSETEESRKLIFYKDNLSNKEHTVEIITTSANKVMLSILGIPYSANLLTASNIYKEKALTISLVVFLLLFVAIAVFVALLIFLPKFRNLCFGNRFIKQLDEREKKPKTETSQKPSTQKTSPATNGETAAKPAKTAKTDKTAKTTKTTKTTPAKPKK